MLQGLNLWPAACRAAALPAELNILTHIETHSRSQSPFHRASEATSLRGQVTIL